MNISKLLALSMVCGLCLSCANEDLTKNQAEMGGAIAFSAESLDGTRAAVATSDTLQKNGFKVYANTVYSSSSKVDSLMKGQEIKYNSSSNQWEYHPIAYFPTDPDASVNFYAVHNNTSKDITTVYGWDQKPHTTYAVNSNVMKQTDFLWAAPVLGATNSNTSVSFDFKHALSSLTISLEKKAEGYESIEAALKALKPEIGTIYDRDSIHSIVITGAFPTLGTINPDATDIKKIWEYPSNDWSQTSYTLMVDPTVDNANSTYPLICDATGKYVTTEKGKLMVFPCGDLTFTMTIYHVIKCTNGDAYLITAKKTVTKGFSAGEDVTYNITYNADKYFDTITKLDENSVIGIDTENEADGKNARQQ